MLLPFLWMFSTSVKPAGEVFNVGGQSIEGARAGRRAVAGIMERFTARRKGMGGGFARWYLNSVLVAVVVNAGAGNDQRLPRRMRSRGLQFPGRDRLFSRLLGTMMIPRRGDENPEFHF